MRDMAYDTPGMEVYPEPERTSLASIFGLIFSLVGCCVGVTALLGVPLSIAGLVSASRSRSRIGGRGLAIAGLIIGLLNLALWGSCLGGGMFSWRFVENNTLDPTERFFVSLQQDQLDAARANLASPAADATDEELRAFREAYRSTLGDFVSRPRGLREYIQSMARMGPWQTVAPQPGGQMMPVVATFTTGDALLIIDMSAQTAAPSALTVYDTNLNAYALPVQAAAPRADSAPVAPPAAGDGSENDGTGNPDPADPADPAEGADPAGDPEP